MSTTSISCVIFDFDGVILDSARIKTEAFVDVYADHPDLQSKIREYHLANQGVSRFVKFAWIAEHLLGQPISEDDSKKLGERFSSIVLNKVLHAEHIAGAREFLEFLSTRQIPAFVASGTPEEELRNIVAQRQLAGYFRGVYGTPKTKVEIIEMVLKQLGIAPQNTLMIGDASTDREAAAQTGCHFQGIWSEEMDSYWRSEGLSVDHDLHQLPTKYGWESVA